MLLRKEKRKESIKKKEITTFPFPFQISSITFSHCSMQSLKLGGILLFPTNSQNVTIINRSAHSSISSLKGLLKGENWAQVAFPPRVPPFHNIFKMTFTGLGEGGRIPRTQHSMMMTSNHRGAVDGLTSDVLLRYSRMDVDKTIYLPKDCPSLT